MLLATPRLRGRLDLVSHVYVVGEPCCWRTRVSSEDQICAFKNALFSLGWVEGQAGNERGLL
jgi:hypothetical protein